jgi:MMP 1-O-methyltransferase
MGNTELKQTIAGVEGYLTEQEGMLLYELARDCTVPGVIVEIGSWKGRSTMCLALGSMKGQGKTIFAIDPHTGSPEHWAAFGTVSTFDEFSDNVRRAGVEDIVVPLVHTSSDVARTFDEAVAMVFIDGAHEFESVKQDFDDWVPKVVEGGIVALHDAVTRPGPRRVARDFVLRSRSFRHVGFVHQLVYAQKTEHNSVMDVVRNQYMLWLICFVGLASSLNLPSSLKQVGGRIAGLLQKPGAKS